jgi:Putative beta-barrel porin-2, OmpL-like. bbp2
MSTHITKVFLIVVLAAVSWAGSGQVVNTATMDTLETTVLGHVAIGGYIDTYWAYNFSDTRSKVLPYTVTSSRNNELNINLAYVDIRYRSNKLRARFVPGFGTYMNANYTNESGTLKHLVEANAGVLVSAKRNIWMDVGVLGSPYTNESAISKDHLMYTRSFAPENVPYYLSGIKFSIPLGLKVSSYVYVLNGWQVIEDTNRGKSIGTQLEFRPNNRTLFNWNTYWGDERSAARPQYRARLFTDIFWIYKPSDRFDATSCIYVGSQKQLDRPDLTWWQVNFIGRYAFNPTVSLSGRIEYFSDPDQAVVTSITPVSSFSTYTSGLSLNIKIADHALLRLEAKHYFSKQSVYFSAGREVGSNTVMVGNLTAWF